MAHARIVVRVNAVLDAPEPVCRIGVWPYAVVRGQVS